MIKLLCWKHERDLSRPCGYVCGFVLIMRRCYATVRCVEFLLELTNAMILEQLLMLRYL